MFRLFLIAIIILIGLIGVWFTDGFKRGSI